MSAPTVDAAVSVNPATGQAFASYPFADATEVQTVLASSRRGFESWRRSTVGERVAVLTTMADALRAGARPLAALITDEMGKPITQAIQEVLKSAQTLDWYTEHGPAISPTRRRSPVRGCGSPTSLWGPSSRSSLGTFRSGRRCGGR